MESSGVSHSEIKVPLAVKGLRKVISVLVLSEKAASVNRILHFVVENSLPRAQNEEQQSLIQGFTLKKKVCNVFRRSVYIYTLLFFFPRPNKKASCNGAC